MKTARGDLWRYPADWRIITTNGFVKTNGEAVMGRGTAWQAKKKYPDLPRIFGSFLIAKGNHVGIFKGNKLLTMPTKHAWYDKQADLVLIERSAMELASLPYRETFVMPMAGCGCGGLLWSEVQLVIGPILDDRFTVLV